MNIFVDENIPLMTVQVLREEGHDVLDIRGTPDEGMEDETLWNMIQRESDWGRHGKNKAQQKAGPFVSGASGFPSLDKKL